MELQKFWIFSLGLIMFCTACSKENFIPVPSVVKLEPPSQLLTEVEVPKWQGKNNADLLDYILQLHSSLVKCNQDKQKLAIWAYE